MEEKTEENETILQGYHDNYEGQEKTWYLDTSASTCVEEKTYESLNDNVSFGDDSKVPLKGRGKILII